ncbi:uncharacterized protein B0H18DRAFT_170931 [Fomitopsis serialis]|uniref:uncharacterized protein n=1 Tax=Fomitopsis serialis TaxID=139415 RepID=UPI0020079F30|nr:uncharacterized protein B0H18DRAFT_170931 [Neoantrodia serialis]KAH9929675.1 hypothetical protein B0H18DRAFT_170931 [Neoantrodia serialis]
MLFVRISGLPAGTPEYLHTTHTRPMMEARSHQDQSLLSGLEYMSKRHRNGDDPLLGPSEASLDTRRYHERSKYLSGRCCAGQSNGWVDLGGPANAPARHRHPCSDGPRVRTRLVRSCRKR